jgi:short-subunit dehydrogenase
MADEIAIVTGASSGIGAELARQLSARGLTVLAVARRKERLDHLAEAARAAGQGAIVPMVLDVTTPGAAERVRDRARELGRPRWLVNNAGIDPIGDLVQQSPLEVAAVVRLNCESVVTLCAALGPDLVAGGAGRILNVASLAGFQPTPHHATYGASKAFVLSFSEALSAELRGTGVTVTALCPGPVTTELFDRALARKKPSHELSAEECARAGIDAAERGRVIAIPGARNRLTAMSAKLVPRALVRRFAGTVGMKYLGYDVKQLKG